MFKKYFIFYINEKLNYFFLLVDKFHLLVIAGCPDITIVISTYSELIINVFKQSINLCVRIQTP